MTLIDPSTRWWNRPAVRRAAVWMCWIVSTLLMFVAGWSMGMAFGPDPEARSSSGTVIAITFVLGLTLLLAGTFLCAFADDDGDEFNLRVIFMPIGAMFMAQGLGAIAYCLLHGQPLDLTATGFAVCGAIGLIVSEIIIRRVERNQALRETVKWSGVLTRGQVTRTRRYYLNHMPVTRVTVAFVDNAGRKRWATETIGGTVRKGQTLTVRYSPADLGRRAGVIVEP